MLAVFYFGVLLFTEYKTLGLDEPIVEIPIQIKQASNIALYVMLAMLSAELILKYMKIRNMRQFLKKYWLDVTMVILIPVFSGIKIFKTVQIAKKAKIIKYGFKAVDKTKKYIKITVKPKILDSHNLLIKHKDMLDQNIQ